MIFNALNISPADRKVVNNLSYCTGIAVARLRELDLKGLEPTKSEMKVLARFAGQSEIAFRLRTGFLDRELCQALADSAEQVAAVLGADPTRSCCEPPTEVHDVGQVFRTSLGTLYRGDCIEIMRNLPDASCDVVFADPPFNLDKLYPSQMDDNLRQENYLAWCEEWLTECVRLLRDGGSLFLYNLPKWNTFLSAFLNRRLTFRHWIAIDIKSSLPISGRLYPSHYSLLYYVKGDRPSAFHPDRLPMDICPACMADLKDYGGYKDKMNPLGVNLTDVWNDIPPVRHAKYKKRKTANELSIKLLDRIVELSSNKGDVILDPFGGSGTTYAVAEMKGRKWIGMELGPVEGVIERLQDLSEEQEHLGRIRSAYNCLFLPEHELQRKKKGLWTTKSFSKHQLSGSGEPVQLTLD